jgi:hypothetical protein
MSGQSGGETASETGLENILLNIFLAFQTIIHEDDPKNADALNIGSLFYADNNIVKSPIFVDTTQKEVYPSLVSEDGALNASAKIQFRTDSLDDTFIKALEKVSLQK